MVLYPSSLNIELCTMAWKLQYFMQYAINKQANKMLTNVIIVIDKYK